MSITLAIIIITCIISITSFSRPNAIDDLSMWPVMVDSKRQYYRFITSGFVHGDWQHLIFNMLTLFFFGKYVESLFATFYGSLSFAGFYLVALIVSDLPSYFKHRRAYGYRSIGASGAVSAIIFVAVMMDPWSGINVFFIIPVPAILYAVLYLVYCVYSGRRQRDNINHDAHLWGGLFGAVCSALIIPGLFQNFLLRLVHPSF